MKNLYDDLGLFCSVIKAGSFYMASKQLNLPHSTVSRRIAMLEDNLGDKLIERTTRQMNMTEKGQALFQQCAPLFERLNAAISDSLDNETELKGPLRITMPTRIGLDYMGEFLVRFNQLHPKLELDILLQNGFTDLVAQNIDLAFRVGPLPDSTAIAKKLWDIPFMLVAHQDTLQALSIEPNNFELKRLSSLPCAVASPQNKWAFDHQEHGKIVISPNAYLQANDLALVLEAAKKTQVLAYVPEIIFKSVADTEHLVSIKGKGWKPQTRSLHAVYTASRKTSQKVKAVIDFALTAYAQKYKE